MAKKPGPKTELAFGETLERVTLMLDPMTRRKLKVLGGDNESKGVRLAARVAFERYQRDLPATRGPRE